MTTKADPPAIWVFCPTHKKSFYVPQANRIFCEDGSHTLTQNFPAGEFWEYCCDCQRFWPSNLNHGGKSESQCPVCIRPIARRYLCDECKVMSVESDDSKVRGKRYMLAERGMVSPECPACSNVAEGTMNRHECEDAGAVFTTLRESCPFCEKPTAVEKKVGTVKATPLEVPPVKKPSAVKTTIPVALSATKESSAQAPVCLQCGEVNKPYDLFCGRCGGLLNILTDSYDPLSSQAVRGSGQPALDVAPPTPKTSSRPLKLLLAAIGGVAVLGVLVTIASLSGGGNSVERKLDTAIARGNLLGPAGDNAYSLYQELKNSGASEATLKRYREKLTPLLTERGYRLATDIRIFGYDEPDASEWQDAGRNLDWAVDLNPGNSYLSARAAYCNGRAAFVQKQFDQAISYWTKAENLDKSWALPVNGIGLIYNGKRDYESARSSFFDAIQREPNWAVPYENVGNAYYMEKNRDRAREFYAKAVAKAPDWAKPHVHLADMAVEDGDYATAVSEFELALNSSAKGLKSQEITKVQQRLDNARQHLSR